MTPRHHTTGVILCGGAASRMGGINKPLVELAGRHLVQHVRERLAPQVASVVISANDDLDRYAEWGDVVVADNDSRRDGPLVGLDDVVWIGNQSSRGGPLVGLDSVLPVVNTACVFCCPGDAPLLDGGLVARLAAALEAEEADAAIPFDGLQSQHLFLLMRTSTLLAASLHDYLGSGARSVHGWLSTIRTATVDASDIANSFTNVNTSSDLTHVAAAIAVAHHSQHSTERL